MSFAELISLSNTELTRLFFAIVLLLVSAHCCSYIFKLLKMPRVVGEILGGLILGPTILGFFAPDAYTWIFNAFEGEGKMISIIYWIGLILLMFISGFEIQRSFGKDDKITIFAVLIGATVIPFIAGWILPSFYDFTPFLGAKENMLALKIIIAIAIAVTSIPVISKIFIDLDVINTRFAKIILSIATIEDVFLWVALAIATGLVNGKEIDHWTIMITIMITIIFFGIMLIIMPRLVRFTNNVRLNFIIKSSVSGYVLFICFLFAAIASILNINIIFGAFLAGVVVGSMPSEKFKGVKDNIKEFSLAFFIPIYFAVVGLKLDLIYNFDLTFFLMFLLFAVIIKTAGTFIAAKVAGKDNLSSLNLAVAMNTRGGPGIVLATVAFDIGIINEIFFVTLVMVAIVTSLMAGYWFKWVLGKGLPLLKE
jgi:Kef-type K+ transport system membrane component KefB